MSAFFFFNDTATTEIYTSFPTRRSSDLLRGENTGQIVWSELGPKRLEESRPADGWDSDRRRARCALRQYPEIPSRRVRDGRVHSGRSAHAHTCAVSCALNNTQPKLSNMPMKNFFSLSIAIALPVF